MKVPFNSQALIPLSSPEYLLFIVWRVSFPTPLKSAIFHVMCTNDYSFFFSFIFSLSHFLTFSHSQIPFLFLTNGLKICIPYGLLFSPFNDRSPMFFHVSLCNLLFMYHPVTYSLWLGSVVLSRISVLQKKLQWISLYVALCAYV